MPQFYDLQDRLQAKVCVSGDFLGRAEWLIVERGFSWDFHSRYEINSLQKLSGFHLNESIQFKWN